MELFDLISNAFQDMLLPKVEKHPKLKSEIEYLSHQYYTYKDSYMFPSKYKGKIKSKFISLNLLLIIFTDFEFSSKLHYVKISFNTPKFEKITKDRAAKFVDMLSAIGGTMGLLTGFSIISGVEIAYFALTFIWFVVDNPNVISIRCLRSKVNYSQII